MNTILKKVEEKIERYRDHGDDPQERHLWFFWLGYKVGLDRGYKQSFADSLEKEIKFEDVASFLQGYREAS